MEWKRYFPVMAALLAVVVVVVLTVMFRIILLPFLFAYIFQFMLSPAVKQLERAGLSHGHAAIAVFAVAFAFVATAAWLIIPALASEIATFQENIPRYSTVVSEQVAAFQNLIDERFAPLAALVSSDSDGGGIFTSIGTYLKQGMFGVVSQVTRSLFSLIPLLLLISVIPFATFFFLYDAAGIRRRIVALVPNRYFEVTLHLLHSLNIQFGMILKGMFTSAVIISLLCSAGLWVIGLEYPVIVGAFAGVSNLIPYFGPVAGTIAACLVALVTGAPASVFLSIVVVFVIVNIIDNTLVQPIVFSRAAHLHPLLVIFLVLAGSTLCGIFGMLAAVPLASLAVVALRIIFADMNRSIRPDFHSLAEIETR